MIGGVVNSDLEATIPLAVQGKKGPHRIDAVIDTGFNGFLTLPPSLIAELGLPWLCRQDGMLADGSIQIFEVYSAIVEWDGNSRTIETDAAEGVPLIGMNLMLNYDLHIQVRDAGRVALSSLP